jgi:hypothetical protein
MSTQNNSDSMFCRTAGSWSGTLGGHYVLNIGSQKVSQSEQIGRRQHDTCPDDGRGVEGRIGEHFGRVWTIMGESKSRQMGRTREIELSIAKRFRNIVRVAYGWVLNLYLLRLLRHDLRS